MKLEGLVLAVPAAMQLVLGFIILPKTQLQRCECMSRVGLRTLDSVQSQYEVYAHAQDFSKGRGTDHTPLPGYRVHTGKSPMTATAVCQLLPSRSDLKCTIPTDLVCLGPAAFLQLEKVGTFRKYCVVLPKKELFRCRQGHGICQSDGS